MNGTPAVDVTVNNIDQVAGESRTIQGRVGGSVPMPQNEGNRNGGMR